MSDDGTTPRPWVYQQGPSDCPHLIGCEIRDLSDAGDFVMIAEVRGHSLIGTNEAAANADLIVQAVNAHDDLVKALATLLNVIDGDHDDEQLFHAKQGALSALEKVKGKS